ICGGAFDGIERKIASRLKSQTIGYTASPHNASIEKENMLKHISPADLKSFGLIPELIGRLPVVSHLLALDKEALLAILTEPKNALLKQYEKLFEMVGIKITFDKNVLKFIVDKDIEFKLGASGLRSSCEA